MSACTGDIAADEYELLRRFHEQGDTSAFASLIDAYGEKAYNIAFRMMGNVDEAQDIAQDCFVKLLSSPGMFRGESAFSTWFYRIVVNKCRDELRRRRWLPWKWTEIEDSEGSNPSLSENYSRAASAEDEVLCRLQQDAIREAVLKLPTNYRIVLVLFDVAGCDLQDIIAITKWPPGTVKSRLHRARKQLRDLLMALHSMS